MQGNENKKNPKSVTPTHSDEVDHQTKGPVKAEEMDIEPPTGLRRGARERKKRKRDDDEDVPAPVAKIKDEKLAQKDKDVDPDEKQPVAKRGRGRPRKDSTTSPQASAPLTPKSQTPAKPTRAVRTPSKQAAKEKLALSREPEENYSGVATRRSRRGSLVESIELDDLDEGGLTRRSGRNVGKRKDYARMQDFLKEFDSGSASAESFDDEGGSEDEVMTPTDTIVVTEKVLEKILAYRDQKPVPSSPRKGEHGSPVKKEQASPRKGEKEDLPIKAEPLKGEVEGSEPQQEFLVKWKGKSYLHAEWVPRSVIAGARMGKSRIQRFFNTNPTPDPDEPFDANFVIVDRIVASKEIDNKTYYFVKWNALQYSEGTWECESDINDDEQIAHFKKRQIRPKEIKVPPRPLPEEFQVLSGQLPYKGANELRAYQHEGLNWLRYCWYNRTNSILADEMGLGKTVQSIAMIDYLFRVRSLRGPFLVIVPLSTLSHWQREFERWTDLNALIYHGNAASRELIQAYEWYFQDSNGTYETRGPLKWNVLITTYEMIIADTHVFKPYQWQYVVIDEAHRLKNKSSRLTAEFSYISFNQLTLLTGTPIQNNTEELWNLLNILDPKQFNSYDSFSTEFGELKEATQVEKLQEILRPFLLRRLKEDVETSIAPKEETIIEVELTQLQKKYYRAILERNFSHLSKGGKQSHLPSLMNIMMQLRKCCNHPFLLKGVEDFELSTGDGGDVNVSLIEAAGKLILIDKLLPKLLGDNHKVLIFSQMVRVLDILEDYLNFRNMKHERIDGSIRGNDRQAAIDRFCAEKSDVHVFLLCTRAGGLGINLTAADTVIIYDSDWNPQNDVQAQARCHRIGQEKKVKIYRLLTRNTYEREMFERASKKLGLDHALLNQLDQSDTKLDKSSGGISGDQPARAKPKSSDVDALLRNGAYGLFSEENDEASRKFCESNIDQILEARTQTIVHSQSPTEAGVSSFGKASFASASSRPELDIHDPDFWAKLMPEQAERPDPAILHLPRERKAAKRYQDGGSDSDLELSEEGEAEAEVCDAGDDYYEDLGILKEKKLKFNPWSQVARNRLQKGILLFGFGRWRMIRRQQKLRKTEKSMELYGKAYMHKLCAILNIDPVESINQVNNIDDSELLSECDEIPIVIEPSNNNNQTTPITDQNQQGGDSLAAIAADHKAAAVEEQMDIDMNKLPTQTEKAPAAPRTTGAAAPVDGVAAAPAEPEYDDHVYDSDRVLNERPFLKKLQKSAKTIFKRLQILETLGDLVRSNFAGFEDMSNWPTSDSNQGQLEFPTWWTCHHDKDLLIGVYRHGFGRYDLVRTDPTLCFNGNVRYEEKEKPKKSKSLRSSLRNSLTLSTEEAKSSQPPSQSITDSTQSLQASTGGVTPSAPSQSLSSSQQLTNSPLSLSSSTGGASQTTSNGSSASALPEWPSAKLLTHRFKQALFLVSSAQHSSQSRGGSSGKAKRSKRGMSLSDRQLKLKTEWSKREIMDFYRVITLHGLPLFGDHDYDFEFIRQRAKLNQKNGTMIRQYYDEFLTQCIKIKYLKKEGKLDEKAKEFTVSYVQAKRALERIVLFDDLRRDVLIYSDDQLRSKLQPLNDPFGPFKQGVPDWWIPIEHDLSLLHGIDKYGFCKWELILSDPKLGFHKILLANQTAATPAVPTTDENKLKESGGAAIKQEDEEEMVIEAEEVVDDKDEELPEDIEEQTSPLKSSIEEKPSTTQDDKLSSSYEDRPVTRAAHAARDDAPDLLTLEKAAAKATPKKKAAPKKKRPAVKKTTLNATLLSLPRDRFFLKRLHAIYRLVRNTDWEDCDEDEEEEDLEILATDPKPRRLDATDLLRRPKKAIDVKLDADQKPILPITIRGVEIQSLGTITFGLSFHSQKHIWPVGFKSSREFLSTVDGTSKVQYTSEIVSRGNYPMFQVTTSEDPNNHFLAKTASEAWAKVVEKVNEKRTNKIIRKISGPEYFGYGFETIANLISKLPGADVCTKYKGPGIAQKISKSSMGQVGGSGLKKIQMMGCYPHPMVLGAGLGGIPPQFGRLPAMPPNPNNPMMRMPPGAIAGARGPPPPVPGFGLGFGSTLGYPGVPKPPHPMWGSFNMGGPPPPFVGGNPFGPPSPFTAGPPGGPRAPPGMDGVPMYPVGYYAAPFHPNFPNKLNK